MLIERDQIIETLKAIESRNYEVPPGESTFELALGMLEYLGDTDSELRDRYIYSILSKWIIEGVFTKEQQKQLLQILQGYGYLFYKIGETGSSSVFMRAFSVLLVAPLVYRHRQDAFLSREELWQVKDNVLRYVKEEKDVRGYIQEGGWAHTAAHSADVLDELALCEELGEEDLRQILQAIKEKVSIDYHGYICYEDERLSVAACSAIGRQVLPETEICAWVRSFGEMGEPKGFPTHYHLLSNIRNFLNSLCYRLPSEGSQEIKKAIRETVLSIRRF
jgi:hypothetical protein